jgi:hypothetical protein
VATGDAVAIVLVGAAAKVMVGVGGGGSGRAAAPGVAASDGRLARGLGSGGRGVVPGRSPTGRPSAGAGSGGGGAAAAGTELAAGVLVRTAEPAGGRSPDSVADGARVRGRGGGGLAGLRP